MEMLIRRRNTTLFQRLIATSRQRCINVRTTTNDVDKRLFKRRNATWERRCINISAATTLRRQVNVGIRRHLWLLKRRDLTLSRRHLRLARPLFNIFKPNKVHMFCVRKRVKSTYG